MNREVKLRTKKGSELFQQEMPLVEAREAPPFRVRLPICRICSGYGLAQDRVAIRGGRWACGRGHGPL